MPRHELAQDLDRAGRRHGVRICDQDELMHGVRCTEVRVCGKREWRVVLDHAYSLQQLFGEAAWDFRDHDQLVDLGRERGQRVLELR